MFYQNHLIPQIKPHAYGMPRSKIDRFWLIHKLASIKSYIACQHRHCASHQITSFVICESCQCVSEIVNAGFDPTLYGLAQNAGLIPRHSTIEIYGLCTACRDTRIDSHILD